MAHFISCFLLLIFFSVSLSAQTQESDLRIFGYFQNSFAHETEANTQNRHNSFNLQQLNLIAQKDLAENWRAFINLKIINNFSTEKRWGAYSIEEAWLRYRYNNQFNLKLGLQIPIFNSFNEIKDRTPLVPYVIKPLVYEDSYADIIPIEDFVPRQAFLQVYGFYGKNKLKFEYALYLGNSSNISTWSDQYISGIDTSDTIMQGWRMGMRYENLRAGISFTNDQVAGIKALPNYFIEDSSIQDRVHRVRLGADFSYEFANFDFKAEYITVFHDEKVKDLNLNKEFFYATLGYYFDEQWYGYVSYWFDSEKFLPFADLSFEVFTTGASMRFTDRITFKAQYAYVKFSPHIYDPGFFYTSDDFNYYGVAASVYF